MDSIFPDSVEMASANENCATVLVKYPWNLEALQMFCLEVFGHTDARCTHKEPSLTASAVNVNIQAQSQEMQVHVPAEVGIVHLVHDVVVMKLFYHALVWVMVKK